jgi:peptidoglycan/LPS O-acetylase OafA/YrhL
MSEHSPETPVKGEPQLEGIQPRPRPHFKHLEGLRALAALVVYVNHAYAQSWNPILGRFPDFPLRIFSYTLVVGHFAVTVFIALSGFCLAIPVVSSHGTLRDGTLGFFRKRARRILPPYYAAFALCLLLIYTIIGEPSGSLWDVPIVIDTKAILSHLFLVQDIFRTGRINYVFWSIAAEWQIYFLFPPLLWFARRRGFVAACAAYLVLGYSISLVFSDTRLGRANPHYIGIFAMGVLAAFVSLSNDERYVKLRSFRYYPAIAAVALGVTLTAVARIGLTVPRTIEALYDGGIGIFTFCTLIATTTAPESRMTKLLSLRPLVVLGTFSYSFYLVHAPLLQILWLYGTERLKLSFAETFAALMTVGLALVLAGAYGFFYLFERPFLSNAAKNRVS